MANYLVQEDGSSRFILEDGSGDLLLELGIIDVVAVVFAGTSSLTAAVFEKTHKRGLHTVANVGVSAVFSGKRGLHTVANVGVPATFTGDRGLHVVANVSLQVHPTFAGTSSLATVFRELHRVTVTLAGTSSLSTSIEGLQRFSLALTGVGHLTATVGRIRHLSLSLAGTSSLTAGISTRDNFTLTLAGTSSLTAIVTVSGASFVDISLSLAGSSSLTTRFSHLQFTLTLAGTSHLRIFSVFDPNQHGVGPGNGGETFGLRLAPNGATETATLDGTIGTTDSTLSLTGDSGFPAAPFVATIDSEVLYLIPRGGGTYSVRGRGLSNTVPAPHTNGVSVVWNDSYDQAITAASDIAHEFTANITDSGDFLYPGWLICFDSSQAYLAGDRYPMHVTSVLGVFDAGAGSGGLNRCDAAQPNATCTPTGVSDDCPAALSNPSRISTDILTGDVALIRYTNPEAVVLDLGPRSAALQSWFGLKRVDATDNDVTFTDPTGYVVDTIPPGPFTGSINGEWGNPIPLLTGIDPIVSDEVGYAVPTTSPVPWTTVTLPGVDRYFTYGPPHYSEKGWPICALAVRQGDRRVPYWASWDWHNYNFVYTGFGPDDTYCQLLINRNGIVFGSVPEVDLPGPQDIDGPDVEWDDPTYFVGASWYVVLFNGPYILSGPGIGGGVIFVGGPPPPPGGVVPGVIFPPSGPPIITVPPIEGGSGGGIPAPFGGGLRAHIRYPVSTKDGTVPTPSPAAPAAFSLGLDGTSSLIATVRVPSETHDIIVLALQGTSTLQARVGGIGKQIVQPTFAGHGHLTAAISGSSGVLKSFTLTLHGS